MTIPPHLHTVDLALIVVYLIGITLFGLSFRKSGKDKSLRNYFLADNTVPWWAIALSIVSAETSTLTIISIPGVAFAGDFGFLQIVIGYMIGRVVVAAIFLPRYFEGRMLTAYQLIDQRFGHTLHKVTAGLFLLTRAAAEGVRVFAVSIVVGIAIGTRDVLSIAIISALTLLYTFEGGMTAVIWTDVVQMAIYIGGTLVAILTLGSHIPGGWSHIHTIASAAGKFHLFHFALNLTQTYTFWAGVIGGTFLTMASHGTDQLMVQRMLAARNLRESRLALLSSGIVIFVQFSLFLLIGAGLYVFYGQHPQTFASGDRIFPTFIVSEMPLGIAGLLVAAILAAAMSNLSAALNSLSSTTVVDFYMHWRPNADDRERMIISRSSTIVWAFVLFAVAVYSVHAGGKGHVVEIGLSIASVAYGALLGVFLLGTLTKYATQTGAICGMIVGFAFNLVLWLLPNSSFDLTTDLIHGQHSIGITIPKIAFTWYVFLGAIVTFAVGSLASLIFRKRPVSKAIITAIVLLTITITSSAQIPSRSALKSVILSGGAAAVEGPAVGAPQTAPDFSLVSTLINDAITQHKLPGAVVLIGHNDRILFEHAYGNRKLAGEPGLYGKPSPAESMTEDTIFDMASLSKCLSTATAIMQLYEQGKLQFDDPVPKYLPDFAANGKQNVTIRELLTHYSGLPPDIDLKDSWGLAAPDKAEGIRRAMASPLVTTPGTHFEYSDINYITLGALVEKLSGAPLDIYAAVRIFNPLEMKETRYLAFDKVCGFSKDIPVPLRSDFLNIVAKGDPGVEIDCDRLSWTYINWAERTAPTAHDNEGTAATNPDFDHLLRGTVHDPTTRRMGGVAGHAGVFSTAADISLYAQALLDKLLYDTGPFPLKQSTLRLMTQPEQPPTAESTATIFTPEGTPTKGIATRGFGWDINTAFSRPRGSTFPIAETGKPGSFGHTGFTGTSLWIDPTSNTYVILLANAIHPRGNPPISHLRGDVATAAAQALGLKTPPATTGPEAAQTFQSQTLTGIDVLEATHFAALAQAAANHGGHLRIGLLTNQTGLDSHGRRTIDILTTDAPQYVPGLQLTTLFSPEHGIFGKQDSTSIHTETDPTTHLPVLSLYGAHDADRRPRPADLAKLDAVLIDLQDAGVRFYTYATITGYFVEATAISRTDLIVLDRPNPIGGIEAQGPVSDPPIPGSFASYINYMPLPPRYGLTLGELARYINGEKHLNAPLTVVPMQHLQRSMFFDDTHLPWTNPSPNLRSLEAATLYPGTAFVETTNVSVGRGSDTPFEHIGAPYINANELAAYLTARHIPGVTITPTNFSISEDTNHYPYHGQTIPGIRFAVTDRNSLDSPELGLELASALHYLYPTQFNLPKAITIIANTATIQALEANQDPRAIAAASAAALASFNQRRKQYMLYP
ncbi:sodium:solute symporter family transporter [Granulicella arctica]|uniref:SSS family transporter n=1 Tax=Granulicella arctica TaxID=940613 RepID=A0A7Y9PK37_9BACT|nr:sodium/solute symporter [Granulicella arctica]NYF80523.1 SSS family transporter [Granulicella arctica]